MEDKKRIYLFANFGDWNKQPYGGGEVGNRRTLELMRKCGYEVKLVEKYKRVNNHSFLNLLLLLFRMIVNVVKFALVLLFGRRKRSIVHIVGFYGPMVYFENVLVAIAHALGYFTVYEMRGGGADLYYEDGKEKYRRNFGNIIKRADCIFSQGKENVPLIESIDPGKSIFYYPNFVMDDFIPCEYPVKPNDRINLLYFGRISATKNIEVVIDSFVELTKRYKNVYLDIVGNCPEPRYAEFIKDKIRDLGCTDRIKLFPACNHEQLKGFLRDKHFYLFPTSEPHEGHSNALTEAMAWGVVPVATRQGFNGSVIGNERLIVPDLSPSSFAGVISGVIENDDFGVLSKYVYDRVLKNYTETVACEHLKIEYDCLFDSI